MASIKENLACAAKILRNANVADPQKDAAFLLSLATEKDRVFLIAHDDYQLSFGEQKLFDSFIARRKNREPIQHITGFQEFYGLAFSVSPDVLIPRPETEILVETSVAFLKTLDAPDFLDIGTGSGCIPIAICKNLPSAKAMAVDISKNALRIAASNADRYSVSDRIDFVLSDLFENILNRKFNAILSNPPYISESDIENLEPEVRCFDPKNALTDHGDGLSFYRRLAQTAPDFLKPEGLFSAEFGFGQSNAILEIFSSPAWTNVYLKSDLQGIPRILVARKK